MQNANHLSALRKVGQQIALTIACMACAIGTAKAEGVISKSAEPRILEAFKPFVPGETVVAPWRIKNIAIVHDRVEVELVTDNQATLIQ